MCNQTNNYKMSNFAEPSICIPRTLNNITRDKVKSTFESVIGKGTVGRVDIVRSRQDDQFCKIFVHFKYWPKNEDSTSIRETLIGGESVKLVYDTPWFWKCVKSNAPVPQQDKKKPYFELKSNKRNVKQEDPDEDIEKDEVVQYYRREEAQEQEQEELPFGDSEVNRCVSPFPRRKSSPSLNKLDESVE